MRVIQDVPEPRYDLSICLRLLRNYMLDRPQGECEQRVAAGRGGLASRAASAGKLPLPCARILV
jgi:hypothetical protein